MWKKIKIDNIDYLLKYSKMNDLRKIQITDFIHLWFEEIPEHELIIRCRSSNSFVQATNEVMLAQIVTLLTSEDSEISRTFDDADNYKVLKLETKRDGFRFRMHFTLRPASHSQFYEEVTLPLLTTVSVLEKQQNQLINLVKRKDLEIMEYKLEGATISRRAVETIPFKVEVFAEECAEGLGVTKSRIVTAPTQVLTPLVQGVLDKIAITPLVNISEEEPVARPNNANQTKHTVSHLKNKRPRLYEDEEEEEVEHNAAHKVNLSTTVTNQGTKTGTN